ncbi:hypothetical protein AB0C07_40525 [Actinoplanes missouriensis]|uniref:hypothetical protein n=1 Tax=Actinoplanes missouriensis TaxID=1866 RepID=UPI0033D39E48
MRAQGYVRLGLLDQAREDLRAVRALEEQIGQPLRRNEQLRSRVVEVERLLADQEAAKHRM